MRYKIGDIVRVRTDLRDVDVDGSTMRYYHDDGSENNVVIPYMLGYCNPLYAGV